MEIPKNFLIIDNSVNLACKKFNQIENLANKSNAEIKIILTDEKIQQTPFELIYYNINIIKKSQLILINYDLGNFTAPEFIDYAKRVQKIETPIICLCENPTEEMKEELEESGTPIVTPNISEEKIKKLIPKYRR